MSTCQSGHQSPVIVWEDESKKIRQMSCQSCGANWVESY